MTIVFEMKKNILIIAVTVLIIQCIVLLLNIAFIVKIVSLGNAIGIKR